VKKLDTDELKRRLEQLITEATAAGHSQDDILMLSSDILRGIPPHRYEGYLTVNEYIRIHNQDKKSVVERREIMNLLDEISLRIDADVGRVCAYNPVAKTYSPLAWAEYSRLRNDLDGARLL